MTLITPVTSQTPLKQLLNASPITQKALTLSRNLDECKPLPASASVTRARLQEPELASAPMRQGLTLVHFSAQSEPFLTHKTKGTGNIP